MVGKRHDFHFFVWNLSHLRALISVFLVIIYNSITLNKSKRVPYSNRFYNTVLLSGTIYKRCSIITMFKVYSKQVTTTINPLPQKSFNYLWDKTFSFGSMFLILKFFVRFLQQCQFCITISILFFESLK